MYRKKIALSDIKNPYLSFLASKPSTVAALGFYLGRFITSNRDYWYSDDFFCFFWYLFSIWFLRKKSLKHIFIINLKHAYICFWDLREDNSPHAPPFSRSWASTILCFSELRRNWHFFHDVLYDFYHCNIHLFVRHSALTVSVAQKRRSAFWGIGLVTNCFWRTYT